MLEFLTFGGSTTVVVRCDTAGCKSRAGPFRDEKDCQAIRSMGWLIGDKNSHHCAKCVIISRKLAVTNGSGFICREGYRFPIFAWSIVSSCLRKPEECYAEKT